VRELEGYASCEARALPTELIPRGACLSRLSGMVEKSGVEPDCL
jgi:hypothetical protein